jgi:hypothetical protein
MWKALNAWHWQPWVGQIEGFASIAKELRWAVKNAAPQSNNKFP